MSLEALGKVSSWRIPYRLKGFAYELANCANAETGLCCPSTSYLAEQLLCDRRTIFRALSDLEAAGVIKVHQRFDGSRQTTSHYEFFYMGEGDSRVRGEGDSLARDGGGEGVIQNQEEEPGIILYKGVRVNGAMDKEAAKEFIDHRINLKARLTQNAFDRAMTAALKASEELGITPEDAVRHTIDAGWKGINSNWLKRRLTNEADQHVRKPGQADRNKFHADYYRQKFQEAVAEELGDGSLREDAVPLWD